MTLPPPVLPLAAVGQGIRDAHRLFHPPVPTGPSRTPAGKRLPVRAWTVTASMDAIPLHAWVVPGRGPHTVIACHGIGRTKSMTLGHVELFHRAGHHVVAYDMRNHGESGTDRAASRMADRFTSDLRDVLRAVADDPRVGSGRIAVLGCSLSTWPALRVLAHSEVPVAAVICDSGPAYDVVGGLGHYATLRRGALPEQFREGVAFAVYRRAFQRCAMSMLDLGPWPPDLTGVPTRLMFIGSAADTVVAADQVRRVAEHYPRARYWQAPDAVHLSALRLAPEEYRGRVLGFLAEAFGTEAPEDTRTRPAETIGCD